MCINLDRTTIKFYYVYINIYNIVQPDLLFLGTVAATFYNAHHVYSERKNLANEIIPYLSTAGQTEAIYQALRSVTAS